MIVLDASVIIKWFRSDETDADLAWRYVENHTSGENVIAVPDLLYYEFANNIIRGPGFGLGEPRGFLAHLFDLQLHSFRLTANEFQRTMEIAKLHKVTAYDASYIVLAEVLKCLFVTADRKLANKVKNIVSVQVLGDSL
jgi:predicted nucleic acid-binding protein